MKDEQSWRIDHERELELAAIPYPLTVEALAMLMEEGVLVPDTRLQAITDEYDRIKARRYLHEELLEYFPELSAVLVDLTEEDE